jgi:hypothetical protein
MPKIHIVRYRFRGNPPTRFTSYHYTQLCLPPRAGSRRIFPRSFRTQRYLARPRAGTKRVLPGTSEPGDTWADQGPERGGYSPGLPNLVIPGQTKGRNAAGFPRDFRTW